MVYEVDRRFHEADGTVIFDYKDRQNLCQVNWGGVANISYVKGRTKISWKNLFNQLYEDKYYVREGYNTSRLNDLKLYSSYLNQRSLATTQLEGEHQLSKGGIKLRWNGNAGYNMKTQPDLRTALYARTINTTQPFDIDPDDTRRFYSDLKDYSLGGGGQLIVPMNWGLKDKQTLKLGGGNITRFRDFSSRIFRYNVTNYNSFIAANGRKPVEEAFQPDNMGNSGFILEEFTNNVDSYLEAHFGTSNVASPLPTGVHLDQAPGHLFGEVFVHKCPTLPLSVAVMPCTYFKDGVTESCSLACLHSFFFLLARCLEKHNVPDCI